MTCSDVSTQNESHSKVTTLANNSRSSAINAGKYTKAKRDEYLSVVSINVNSLKSKLKAPDFEEYIAAHDIVTLSETKLNCLDNQLEITGFDIFSNTRKNCKTSSGGVAIMVKKHLSKSIEILKSGNENILLCKLKKHLLGKSVLLGSVYVPPENSKYSKIDLFDSIEREITESTKVSDDIILFGDFNARSGNTEERSTCRLYEQNKYYFDISNHTEFIKRYSVDNVVNN